jgi:hypothetical protein
MKKERKEKKIRLTKLEVFAESVRQDHAHQSTVDISRRRHVLTCELTSFDTELNELALKVQDIKERRAFTFAAIEALGQIVGKR